MIINYRASQSIRIGSKKLISHLTKSSMSDPQLKMSLQISVNHFFLMSWKVSTRLSSLTVRQDLERHTRILECSTK